MLNKQKKKLQGCYLASLKYMYKISAKKRLGTLL